MLSIKSVLNTMTKKQMLSIKSVLNTMTKKQMLASSLY